MYNPFLLADFYKISHRRMYPQGTERVYSTWIPRSTYIEGTEEVIAFGFQAFIQKYLVEFFNENFFARPKDQVLSEYARIIRHTLGVEPETQHLSDLHDLGYLPIEIKALPEGTLTPLRVPMLTIENTDDQFFWLTNSLETLFSTEVWQASTSATIAHEYRKILNAAAIKTTGSTAGVEFQGHDFSMRGMANVDAAAASGAGHLLSFSGTDTIPAIQWAEEFYGANVETELVGTSIPATEHSVMCAYGDENEEDAFRRIITEVHPNGLVSIVSDTYDLFHVLTDTLPKLHDEIMARDGKLVIRPDSGDPADIVCGTHSYVGGATPEQKGVIELLWDEFGGTINDQGFKVLDSHVGCIYGDAISLVRAKDITLRLMLKGFASTNIVFGIGSYTYQYQTRDTFGFALKSTWVRVNGEGRNIFKDPVTDTKKTKRSLTGRVVVLERDGKLEAVDGLSEEQQAKYADLDQLQTVFWNGTPLNGTTLAEIRARVSA